MAKAVLPSIRDVEFFDLLTTVSERMLYAGAILNQSDQGYAALPCFEHACDA